MKKKSMVFLVTLALLAGTISGCGSSKGDTEVTAGENQSLTYAMVTAIEGNDMTYREVDQSMVNRFSGTKSSNKSTSGSESAVTATEKTKESKGTSTSKKSEKTATVQIPVGVTVHTASNTNTTFSRIRSGDILKMLFQKDDDGKEVIVGIWMVK